MQIAPKPANETERLQSLWELEILTEKQEKALDELTELASRICQTPVSLVTLIDQDRQFFKSRVGLDVYETPREISFCAHAILGGDLMIVEDTHKDERFFDNPLVTGPYQVRFYAGFPLASDQGLNLGTLCVVDMKPRQLDEFQRRSLQILGYQAARQLELVRSIKRLYRRNADLQSIMQNISQGIFLLNANLETQNEVSAQLPKILGIPAVAQHQNLRDLFQKVQLTDQQRIQLESQIAQAFERNSWAGDTLPEEFRVYPSQTLEVKWDPVYGQDQKLERVLVALKDVTPQRALFEQKTAMSEKMATIGELVYDLSHELRNAQLSSQPNLEVERQRFSLLLAAVEMGEYWPDLERAVFLDHKPNIQLATDCNRYIKRSDLSAPQRKFALSLLGLDLPVPLAEAILQRSQSFPLEHQAMVHALFGNLESFIQMLYSARRTAAITMSVLEHSRTDQGASYAQLSSLIESSLVLLQKKAKSLNVQVQNDLNAQLQVYVNKSEINQIVLNLVKNSLEAFELGTSTPASPRTIHLASQEMGEFTAVSIQDNAGGIPAEIIDRIFERRFSTKGEKGNGLGLYLAQKLALKNGGTLDVESTDGKTKFTLWLRRREVMEVAA